MSPQPASSVELTLPQQRVLSLLASGSTIYAAADAAGIHRNTVHNWRRASPSFRAAAEHLASLQAAQWRAEIQSLAPLALDTLRHTLTAPGASPGLRLRAALAVLKHATAAAPEPRPADFAAGAADVEDPDPGLIPDPPRLTWDAGRLASRLTSPLASDAPPEPPPPAPSKVAPQKIVHNSAQPPRPEAPETYRRAAPKTGRNELCPCGSGLKHKRCCLSAEALQSLPPEPTSRSESI